MINIGRCHARTTSSPKILPCPKLIDEHFADETRFISLERLLERFQCRSGPTRFVQLFESSSLDEIRGNYKNNMARQFIVGSMRQAALINGTIACLIVAGRHMSIPSESPTARRMTDDERLLLNMALLYRGLHRQLLTRNKHWYLADRIDQQENVRLERVFQQQSHRP
jgi:hypothetical protein